MASHQFAAPPKKECSPAPLLLPLGRPHPHTEDRASAASPGAASRSGERRVCHVRAPSRPSSSCLSLPALPSPGPVLFFPRPQAPLAADPHAQRVLGQTKEGESPGSGQARSLPMLNATSPTSSLCSPGTQHTPALRHTSWGRPFPEPPNAATSSPAHAVWGDALPTGSTGLGRQLGRGILPSCYERRRADTRPQGFPLGGTLRVGTEPRDCCFARGHGIRMADGTRVPSTARSSLPRSTPRGHKPSVVIAQVHPAHPSQTIRVLPQLGLHPAMRPWPSLQHPFRRVSPMPVSCQGPRWAWKQDAPPPSRA